MKKALVGLVLVGIGVVAVLALRHPGEVVTGKPATASPSSELPASSVLRINPRSPIEMHRATAPPPAPMTLAPEVTQLRSRTGWAPLKERLASAPATGVALYVQAELYNRCAKRPQSGAAPPKTREQARERFMATIEGQPDFAQRLAAYDKHSLNACEGIAPEVFSEEKLEAMIAAAAQAGDPRAQAWQTARAVQAAASPHAPGEPPRGNVITDEQVETIRRTLATRDPGVVREYQGILASTLADGTWRIPGIEGRIDERALWAALTLVACDLGDNCGSDSGELLSACATNGYCAATNVYDHTYFYESSPNQAQLLERYRQALVQAINSGDLAGLRIVREPINQSRQYMFRGRRGP